MPHSDTKGFVGTIHVPYGCMNECYENWLRERFDSKSCIDLNAVTLYIKHTV